MKPVPQKWISRSLKCHDCGHALLLYEWGDWGRCVKCGTIWCMFNNKPKDTEHYQGEEAITK